MRIPRVNRHAILYSWLAAAVLAAGYIGWTMLSRHSARLPAPARAPKPAVQAGPEDTGVRILQFYPNTFEIVRGEHAVVCYGVANAASVRLEPPVEKLYLTHNRCISVEPERTTTYTIIAQGKDGARVREQFEIRVKPPGPSILFIEISAGRIQRGQPVVLCYGVRHAQAVRVSPPVAGLVPSEKRCVRFFPVRTADYTFIAAGEGGRTDREKFRITVE